MQGDFMTKQARFHLLNSCLTRSDKIQFCLRASLTNSLILNELSVRNINKIKHFCKTLFSCVLNRVSHSFISLIDKSLNLDEPCCKFLSSKARNWMNEGNRKIIAISW